MYSHTGTLIQVLSYTYVLSYVYSPVPALHSGTNPRQQKTHIVAAQVHFDTMSQAVSPIFMLRPAVEKCSLLKWDIRRVSAHTMHAVQIENTKPSPHTMNQPVRGSKLIVVKSDQCQARTQSHALSLGIKVDCFQVRSVSSLRTMHT